MNVPGGSPVMPDGRLRSSRNSWHHTLRRLHTAMMIHALATRPSSPPLEPLHRIAAVANEPDLISGHSCTRPEPADAPA